jgi:hypothetical protein
MLCDIFDIGSSICIIPYSLCLEIKSDIDPIQMDEAGMTILLANIEYICSLDMVRNVKVIIGKIKYPPNFRLVGCS